MLSFKVSSSDIYDISQTCENWSKSICNNEITYNYARKIKLPNEILHIPQFDVNNHLKGNDMYITIHNFASYCYHLICSSSQRESLHCFNPTQINPCIQFHQWVIYYNDNDVLSGRGGRTNGHPGNISFREIVKEKKEEYIKARKRHKPLIAREIVDNIRQKQPPGRFLKKDKITSFWKDIGNKKAVEKTSQALREGASKVSN